MNFFEFVMESFSALLRFSSSSLSFFWSSAYASVSVKPFARLSLKSEMYEFASSWLTAHTRVIFAICASM